MARHNQQDSRFVSRFSRQERKEPVTTTTHELDQRTRVRPSHWSRISHQKPMNETPVLAVRSWDEMQDYLARY